MESEQQAESSTYNEASLQIMRCFTAEQDIFYYD